MSEAAFDYSELDQFIGTEQYYKNFLGLRYTDGVRYLAERAGAYWLIDYVASYQHLLSKHKFQVWKFTVKESQCVVEVTDGNGKKIHKPDPIAFTTLPDGEVSVWLIDGVLLLPSEY